MISVKQKTPTALDGQMITADLVEDNLSASSIRRQTKERPTHYSSVEGILARLNKVRKSGHGWVALCPAHDDHHPSLSIDEGEAGKVLLYCFAGCTYREVCDALGIGPLELDGGFTATKRGRYVAKLSRLSHHMEVAFLINDYGLSRVTAERLVQQRLKRTQMPEVRELVFARKTIGRKISAVEYFQVEIGLDRTLAEALSGRFLGRVGNVRR